MHELDYWERLNKLKIYSLERRRERYIILYVFKIIYGDVPNPGLSWYMNDRRGRFLKVPSNKSGKFTEKSFFYKACETFNCLPRYIRNHEGTMVSVKSIIDDFLTGVPDKPRMKGY